MSGNGERVISSGCGCRAVRGEAGKWRRHANTSRRASKGQEHINQYWRMSEDVTADAAHLCLTIRANNHDFDMQSLEGLR
jgi:hypothetical protein